MGSILGWGRQRRVLRKGSADDVCVLRAVDEGWAGGRRVSGWSSPVRTCVRVTGQVPEPPAYCEVRSCISHKAPQEIPTCGRGEKVRGFFQGPRNEVRTFMVAVGSGWHRGCLGRWRRRQCLAGPTVGLRWHLVPMAHRTKWNHHGEGTSPECCPEGGWNLQESPLFAFCSPFSPAPATSILNESSWTD